MTSRLPVVLIVEDEPIVRMAIADYLMARDLHVIEAASAAEAMSVFASAAQIDLVFSDIQMPGAMDGLGLCSWVRKSHPGIGLLVTSGAGRSADVAADLCEMPFTSKPYDLAQVERTIRSLLSASAHAARCAAAVGLRAATGPALPA